ncbi:uracil-DNA glycosylase family protein [Sphingomonas flavescens]|uniref:uracil-DNA glycosylase family protein n=1 Tax=Sphingomonas flavescens TaxID=3132797 RepID=UPI002804AB85|nr:uracil-DNA glycosylase family protein [Sphingomonas limnosediminicola]
MIGEAEARSALGWWLQAGVDVVVQEEPRNWLLPPQPRKPASPSEPLPEANVAPPSHETLAALQDWLASSTKLPLASATARRIMPHGPENAEIMLLTEAPTLEDFASGQPIGGDSWELAKRMLAAIKIAPEQAYSASLSCFNAPGARMTPAQREECAEIARQHIQLAKPSRLLLFGDGPSQALLGKPLAQARGHVYKVEGVRTVATFHPRHLINQPSNKSLAWKDLLLLMENES